MRRLVPFQLDRRRNEPQQLHWLGNHHCIVVAAAAGGTARLVAGHAAQGRNGQNLSARDRDDICIIAGYFWRRLHCGLFAVRHAQPIIGLLVFPRARAAGNRPVSRSQCRDIRR